MTDVQRGDRQPAFLVIVLVDQGAIAGLAGGSKLEAIAQRLDRFVQSLCPEGQPSPADGAAGRVDVAIICYSVGPGCQYMVESTSGIVTSDSLRELVPIDLAIKPSAEPKSEVYPAVIDCVDQWSKDQTPKSIPPIVINITAGEKADAHYGFFLRLRNEVVRTAVIQCHLASDESATPLEFPWYSDVQEGPALIFVAVASRLPVWSSSDESPGSNGAAAICDGNDHSIGRALGMARLMLESAARLPISDRKDAFWESLDVAYSVTFQDKQSSATVVGTTSP